jgi:branched-chain amino acid transport system ATP-binding protein
VSAVLVARDITAGYAADVPIVRGASIVVSPGEILVLLGPNGAGKSTLLKAVVGLVPFVSGEVRLGTETLAGLPPPVCVARGIGYVPQVANVFTTLTVEENLRAGAYATAGAAPLDEAYARFPDLRAKSRQAAGQLSGGQRQMLAIARALMLRPKALLLDEPSAGLSPKVAAEMFVELRRIAEAGVAVLLVEQNVRAGLRAADRAAVLGGGRIVLEEPAGGLVDDKRLGRLFLGDLGVLA